MLSRKEGAYAKKIKNLCGLSDTDKKMLEGAPSFGPTDSIDWEDEKWRRRIHDYYGVDPYF